MWSSESIHWVLQVFSPTYYSSSFATALPHSRKAFRIDCSFAMKMVCSTHSPIVSMYQHNIHLHLYLPEQISLFCRGITVRFILHLQVSCKKKPQIQADKSPPAFQPEAKAITAQPAVCIRKHSNSNNFGLCNFQLGGLCKSKPKTKQNSPGFLLTSKLLNWPKILFYPLRKRNSGDSSADMIEDKGHFTDVQ